VTKLAGKRRNPWRARVTVGWEIVTDQKTREEKTKQVHYNCGCYEKKIHAMQALTAYHNNPQVFKGLLELYKSRQITLDELLNLQKPKTKPDKIITSVEKVGTTLQQLYTLWRADNSKYGGASKSDKRLYYYDQAYVLCEGIKHMLVEDITLEIMQKVVDQSDKSKVVLSQYKQMLKALFKYAIIHDIITPDKNKVEFIDLSNARDAEGVVHKPFTSDEIDRLWEVAKSPSIGKLDKYIPVVLILIYTGVRISELLDLKKEDVFIDKRFFKVIDAKTKAGIRLVPIAEKVVPFFEQWMSKSDSTYLITGFKNQHITHNAFRLTYWNKMMGILSLNHTQHDTRYTCVSLLTTAKVDERWIKQIVGHKAQDITQDVYTDIAIEPLLEAINLI